MNYGTLTPIEELKGQFRKPLKRTTFNLVKYV